MAYDLADNLAYKMLEDRKAHRFIADINRITTQITPILNEICIYFDNYTLHNIDHSLRVLHNMCAIVGENVLKNLSDLELAMIIFSALLHDVGMWLFPGEREKIESSIQFEYYLRKNHGDKSLALQDYIRPIHGKRSYIYIMNDENLTKSLCDSQLSTVSFQEDIALICQSHMESIDWIDRKLKESFSKSYHYNSKYISLLLRIADYIDFDSQRAPQYLFEHKNLDEYSFMEWKKHAVVCNSEKIDSINRKIYFDIECDDFELYCKLMDTFNAISKEVYESVLYSKRFEDVKYHLSINDNVQYNIETKGFRPERFLFTLDYYKVTNLLMGENLYGDKRCGFRELLQNCFDACNVMKEYYLMHDLTVNYEPQISIIYDYDDKAIKIRDNGTGMSKGIISDYFLTVGKSYYRSDEYEKKGYKINPMGTFGIGFLACFMLSHNVTIITKYYDTGEVSSFLLKKNSKYICYLDKTYTDVHGTEVSLSMSEFEEVFTKESLLHFIDENFYCLDVKVNIYEKKSGIISYVNEAKATKLIQYLDIDLSPYLKGVECRARLETFVEEFKLHNTYIDVEGDDYNIVLFTLEGISLIKPELIYKYRKNRCVLLFSSNSFEELIYQTYGGSSYFMDSELDAEELIEDFERYGYKAFDSDFNKYLAEESGEWWIDDLANVENLPTCVLWDDFLQNEYIYDILQQTKIRYLVDIDAITKESFYDDKEGVFIVKYSSGYKDLQSYERDLYPTYSGHIRYYSTSVCYRGVLLSDVNLIIPYIANVLSTVNVTVNVFSDKFTPSVTRRGITEEQEQTLSYAIGKAIHIYLLRMFNDDKEIKSALETFIKKKYYAENIFCENIDLGKENI